MIDISVERIEKMPLENLPALQRQVLTECPRRMKEFSENLRRAVEELRNKAARQFREAEELQALTDAAFKFAEGDINMPLHEAFDAFTPLKQRPPADYREVGDTSVPILIQDAYDKGDDA